MTGTTKGLGRHIEAIALVDPTLAGPTHIMKVSDHDYELMPNLEAD